jgi:hypothetical protein
MLRRLSFNAALVAASLFVTLAVWEIGLRLYGGIPLLELTNFIGDRVNRSKYDGWVVYDERLGWRPKPDLRSSAFNTGPYGIRLAKTASGAVPTGGILASGDSFTLGSDVSDEESWPAYLETITGTPVVNAGAAGWGTDQIVMRAEEMIDIARPRTLIADFLWYDIGRAEEEINFGAHKPYYTVEDNQLVLHNVPVPPFIGHPGELGLLRGTLGYSYAIYWAAEGLGLERWLGSFNTQHKRATPGGTGERITCLLLNRLKERAATDQIRLMMVMQYGAGDFDRPQPSAATSVISCAREMAIETVDIWSSLAEIHAKDRVRFRSLFIVQETGWSHMSADGNRLVAAAIADQLQAAEAGTGSHR